MLGLAGVTAMDFNTAVVTVSELLPEIVPDVAVMVVVPADTPEARPDAFTLAIAVAADDQMAVELMSTVVPPP